MFTVEVEPPKISRFRYASDKLGEAIALKLRDIYETRPARIRGYLLHSLGWLPLRADEQAALEQAAVVELERQFQSGEAELEDGPAGSGSVEIDDQGGVDWGSLLPRFQVRRSSGGGSSSSAASESSSVSVSQSSSSGKKKRKKRRRRR